MISVALVAGYATRLYPLTKNFPKPLLEVNGKSILDRLMEDIDNIEEVTEHVIISNHKFYDHFKAWSENSKLKKKITILDDGSTDNNSRLGAVKDIWFAIDKLNLNDDLFIIAGDNIIDFSFDVFVDYFNKKNTSCIMRYYEKEKAKLQKCGVVEVDENDLVLDMVEKPAEPKTHNAVPPFYIYKKEDLPLVDKGIKDGCQTDAPGSFIAWLCKESKVYAMDMPGNRYDIGDLESYEKVKREFKK